MPVLDPATPPADPACYPVDRKTGYHHGKLRAALVVAGLELLENAGLEALSLRSIAARVGVSHTAPKNHFANIKALRSALACEGFWRLAKVLKDATAGNGPRRDKLRSAVQAYAHFALDQPAVFQLMYSPGQCDPTDAALAEAEQAAVQTLSMLADGLDWPRNHAPYGHQRTEWMLWSYMHGYAMLALSGRLMRDAQGQPVHDVLKVMPDFEYGR